MIYADYNGSAPLLPVVKEHLKRRLESDLFANPNAIHSLGQKVNKGIEKCREIIATAVGCYPDQIIINSGASEGISTVINSVISQAPREKKIILTSKIEHAAVLSALEHYSKNFGFEIKMIEVESNGKINLEHFYFLIEGFRKSIALVSIMAANNETGVIQPYKEIASICKKEKIEYFSDTTQLIGKGNFNFLESGMDYAVCSGHKIGALTGSGFIIAKEPTKLVPLIFGKNQEKGLRGGTQNYLGIETLAIALQDFLENREKLVDLQLARENFEREIMNKFPEVVILGGTTERLPGTTLIGYPGIHGQAVQIELESNDIFVTTSAACSDNQPETSDVLKSMNIDDQLGRSVIRISLSYSHGYKDYSILAQNLTQAYNKLKKIHSF
jgi:cysteine desulfurase